MNDTPGKREGWQAVALRKLSPKSILLIALAGIAGLLINSKAIGTYEACVLIGFCYTLPVITDFLQIKVALWNRKHRVDIKKSNFFQLVEHKIDREQRGAENDSELSEDEEEDAGTMKQTGSPPMNPAAPLRDVATPTSRSPSDNHPRQGTGRPRA